jgi:hypothetical protein
VSLTFSDIHITTSCQPAWPISQAQIIAMPPSEIAGDPTALMCAPRFKHFPFRKGSSEFVAVTRTSAPRAAASRSVALAPYRDAN